jgi:MFS family permease
MENQVSESSLPAAEQPQRFGLIQWLVVGTSALGFALDIYELLMLPLIVRPAVAELAGSPTASAEFLGFSVPWVGLMFFVPALVGGLFGLYGGYLTDRLGRRRVLVWTVILYQSSACLAAFSTSMEMLLILRCFTFMGVCIEFVAAVAWLAELFPTPRQREIVLGYTQAFSSVGGFLAAGAWYIIVANRHDLPPFQMPEFLTGALGTIRDEHASWRYMLMSGLIPALPLILIRPFLPESPIWQQKKAAGTLRRPRFAELFQPQLRRTTFVTTLMFACSYGAAFGAIQHLPGIVPGLPEVQSHVKDRLKEEKETRKRPLNEKEAKSVAQDVVQPYVSTVQMWQEVGGLIGRFLLAYLAVVIVSRRTLMRAFQIPGLILLPFVFLYAAVTDLTLLKFGILLIGLVTVAQFSFWGNYLPRAYPVHLRGTGESFAANVGGRIVGTSMALVTTNLAPVMPGDGAPHQLAVAAAVVGMSVYVIGFLLCFILPEPKSEEALAE